MGVSQTKGVGRDPREAAQPGQRPGRTQTVQSRVVVGRCAGAWTAFPAWELPCEGPRRGKLGVSRREAAPWTRGGQRKGWGWGHKEGVSLTLAQLQALGRAGQVLAGGVLGPLQAGQHG